MKHKMKYKIFILAATGVVVGGCSSLSDTHQYTAHQSFESAVASSRLSAEQKNSWSQKMEEQKTRLEAVVSGTTAKVSHTENNRLKLEIPSDRAFSTFSSKIKSGMQPVLNSFASSAIQNSNTQITIVGHTDKLGSDAVNNPLSIKRAAQTLDYLVARGVPSHRIKIEGRGSYEPVTTNNTSANRAQNRRVVIFLSEQSTIALSNN